MLSRSISLYETEEYMADGVGTFHADLNCAFIGISCMLISCGEFKLWIDYDYPILFKIS